MSWDRETTTEALERLHDLTQELDLVAEREEGENLLEFLRGAMDGLCRYRDTCDEDRRAYIAENGRLHSENDALREENVGLRGNLKGNPVLATFDGIQKLQEKLASYERLRQSDEQLVEEYVSLLAEKNIQVERLMLGMERFER